MTEISNHDEYTQKMIDHCGGADMALEQCLDLFAALYERAGTLLMDDQLILSPEELARAASKTVKRRHKGQTLTFGPALCDSTNEEGNRLQIKLLDLLADPVEAILNRVHEKVV